MDDFDEDFGEFELDYFLPRKAGARWESTCSTCWLMPVKIVKE